MNRKKHIVAALMVISFSAQAGGGWVHSKGKGFFKLNEWWIVANQHFISNGKIDPNITSGLFNTSLYGEYGISDKINIMTNISVFSRTFVNEEISGTTGEVINKGEALNSIGDSDIGIKYGIIRNKPFVMSATLMLGLPLGEINQGTRGILATGDGEFNQYLSLQTSTSKNFGKLNTFYSVNIGINNRTKGFSDELRAGLEVGGIYNKKLIVIYRLQALRSFKNSSFEETNGASLFASDAEYTSSTIELGYEVKEKFGISASVGGAFAGRLIYANKSYSVGVYMKL